MNTATVQDALAEIAHSRARLDRLVSGFVDVVDAMVDKVGPSPQEIVEIRDALDDHRVREEVLFQLLHALGPETVAAVARLDTIHDALRSTLGRLADLTEKGMRDSLAFYLFRERFGAAYSEHRDEEKSLLEGLAMKLAAGADRGDLNR